MSVFSRIKKLLGMHVTPLTVDAVLKSDTKDARSLKRKAMEVIRAETKAETAILKDERERKEFSAYLSAYKRKAEAQRKLLIIPDEIFQTKIPQPHPKYQLGVTFDLENIKTGEKEYGVDGWSRAHERKDYDISYNEAVQSAQNTLTDNYDSKEWKVIGQRNKRWRVFV